MAIRGVSERLAAMARITPDLDGDGKADGGACANTVMRALNAPAQGFKDATAVLAAVIAGKHLQVNGGAPDGAIHYWDGGSEGHGHVAFAVGGQVMSVDVNGAGTVGVKPFSWFAEHWPALRYRGWSWWWGRIDTEPKGGAPVSTIDIIDYDFLGKPGGSLAVGTSYKKLDQSTWDPPRAGLELTLVYLNIVPEFRPGKTRGGIKIRLVRAGGDMTAYKTIIVDADALDVEGDGKGHHYETYVYFELGDGRVTHFDLKCVGGLRKAAIGTRYTKKAVVLEKVPR